jgi:transposase
MRSAQNVEALMAAPVLRRRCRSKQERRRIVEQTLQPGASVAVIARQDGVNANQVFHWQKLLSRRAGGVETCIGATVAGTDRRIAEAVSIDQSPELYAGSIVVELGRARVRVEGPVDTESLRLILERVGR